MLCANDLVVAYESNPTTPLKQTGMRVYISPSTGDFSEVSPIDVGSADQETVSVTVDDTRPGSPLPQHSGSTLQSAQASCTSWRESQ